MKIAENDKRKTLRILFMGPGKVCNIEMVKSPQIWILSLIWALPIFLHQNNHLGIIIIVRLSVW